MYRQCVYQRELWFVTWLRLFVFSLFVSTVKTVRLLWPWTDTTDTFFTT